MLVVRKASFKDVKIIVNLWKEFMKYHDELVVKENPKLKPYLIKKKNAAKIFKKFIEKNVKARTAAVFLAEMDGKPAGYSLIYIKKSIPVFKLEKIGSISDLFVKKEFRGKGISSKLKDEVVNWFRKKGIKHISLAVYNGNKHAHSIYEKWDLLIHTQK